MRAHDGALAGILECDERLRELLLILHCNAGVQELRAVGTQGERLAWGKRVGYDAAKLASLQQGALDRRSQRELLHLPSVDAALGQCLLDDVGELCGVAAAPDRGCVGAQVGDTHRVKKLLGIACLVPGVSVDNRKVRLGHLQCDGQKVVAYDAGYLVALLSECLKKALACHRFVLYQNRDVARHRCVAPSSVVSM